MKSIKNKIFILLIVIAVLMFVFFCGQNVHNTENKNTDTVKTENIYDVEDIKGQTVFNEVENEQKPEAADKYKNPAMAENKPEIEQKNAVETDNKEDYTCTLSVKCDTIYNNPESFDSGKAHIIPQGGIIYAEQEVIFEDGETVFDVLLKEMKKNKIHLEFVNTPVYNSAYIEGIANIYEFDCGELSGWLYSVNGVFPNYGCSSYRLKPGDEVEWVYTLNLGADVGGEYSARNGREINE